MTNKIRSYKTTSQLAHKALFTVWIAVLLFLCSWTLASARPPSCCRDNVPDDSAMYAFNPKLFCEVFSPCPRLEVPVDVLRMNYYDDLDMFSRVMVLVKIICDSNGLINFTRTLPVSFHRNEVLSQARIEFIEHLEHFFRQMIGVTTLRAEYVYCSKNGACKCPPASEVHHPRDGSAIFLVVDIGNDEGFIPTYWLVEPTGYHVPVPVPDKRP